MHSASARPATRRRFLGTTFAAGLGLGLAACGSDDDNKNAGAADPDAPWTFVDDRHKRVRLDRRPTRVVCLTDTTTAALWAAGLRPVGGADNGTGITTAAHVDFARARKISDKDGEIDPEALAALRPDLLIDAVQADGKLQAISTTPKLADLAPAVGLDVYRPVEQIVATADHLTTALGAELADGAAKARYAAAADALRRATRGNPELRVGFVFGMGADGVGVMNPRTWAVLKTVAALGVNLVRVPSGADNLYSRRISWERVGDIPADLLVWAVPDPLPTQRIWKAAPAVAAGQVWKPALPSWYAYTYDNFALLLSGLAEHVATARPGVGPGAGA
ncbi:MAG TPA: ABC transporter substrate-binding protein [Baekduia sp.]|uniref:ABC transporter substrate-binding protein n=1 Tax=Baekduia sp. TaxID=2600305 RepID=UPI002D788790|nr:ABC transporter substrate-binding protein [Baekduia sp.]HET6508081.1 ABC transporter substrate-binding protein [Baekduia sp.]